MFIICNYLDVENKNQRTDGFVVEECSTFSEELAQFVIVCREHRINDIYAWARNNMGSKFAMFEKQMSVNKTKAMTFVRVKGGIKSYTEELITQAGGIEKFKELYCKQSLSTEKATAFGETTAESVVTVPESQSELTEEEAVTDATAHVADDLGTTKFNVEEGNVLEVAEPSHRVQTVNVVPETEELCDDTDNSEYDVMMDNTAPLSGNDITPLTTPHLCPGNCIYNSDGSFKGFAPGQVLSLLEHLKELDSRIMLDRLDPEYVLSKDEIKQTLSYLDTISPNVFKAFIMFEMKNASEEIDRIRMSGLLDRFCTFVNDLNRQG